MRGIGKIISAPTPSHRGESFESYLKKLVGAHCYVHDKGIILCDLFPRNTLFDRGGISYDDLSLKLCDFGNSIKLPALADVSTMIIHGTSAQVDIFNLGWLIYSLVKWEVRSFDLFGPKENADVCGSEAIDSDIDDDEPSWPQELPETSELWCGDIICKYWTKNAFEHIHAIQDALFQEFGVIF